MAHCLSTGHRDSPPLSPPHLCREPGFHISYLPISMLCCSNQAGPQTLSLQYFSWSNCALLVTFLPMSIFHLRFDHFLLPLLANFCLCPLALG